MPGEPKTKLRRVLSDATRELRLAGQLLTTAELCLRWKLNRSTIAKIVANGSLDVIRLTPRSTRYTLASVRRYERRHQLLDKV
jgi:hypothetical protein